MEKPYIVKKTNKYILALKYSLGQQSPYQQPNKEYNYSNSSYKKTS